MKLKGTALALVETAERLMGQHGVEGVSLRRIALEAGTSNYAAVHYFFGDLAGLINAIFACRVPAVEAARARLLEGHGPGACTEVGALLDMLFRPLAAPEGQDLHHYAAFLIAVQRTPYFQQWAAIEDIPTTRFIRNALSQACRLAPGVDIDRRVEAISVMILDRIAEGKARVEDGTFVEVIAMGRAALLVEVNG